MQESCLQKNLLNFQRLSLDKAIEGQNFLLKGLVKTKKNSPAIDECANILYGGVVGQFRSALGELKDEPIFANYDAKIAGDDSGTCEIVLAAAQIVNPAISALKR